MKLTIAYLYYDLLNLYGEKGNLKEIIKELENQQIDYEIKYLSINDSLIFKDYDLVIMNAGTENNQKIVIKHLQKETGMVGWFSTAPLKSLTVKKSDGKTNARIRVAQSIKDKYELVDGVLQAKN